MDLVCDEHSSGTHVSAFSSQEFNMPSKRPQTNAGRAAARPASSGKGARNGSHPVSSGSGASQPASSAGSCSQPATVSTTHQTPPEDFDLEDLRARVRRLGRFPNRIMNPQTEAEQEEKELWSSLWHLKSLGMPDEDWNSLYTMGRAMQRYVDAREAVIDDVEALVKKFRRFPKRSHPGTKVSFSQTEENNLTKRLQRVKSHFDDDQQMRFIAVQEQCDAAIQDEKRVMWRMLLDDLSQFVRDSRRWPITDRKGRQSSTFRKFDNPNRSEDLLAERLAKTTKEFDEAHLAELRNLQIVCQVEGLVKEVTDLGRWPLRTRNKSTEDNLARRIQRMMDSHAGGASKPAVGGASQPAVIAQLEDLRRKFLQERADQMLEEAEALADPMLAFADEASNRIEQELQSSWRQ